MGPGMGIESAQRSGNQSFLDSFSFGRPKVLVIGCGGAGGNSVHRLHRMGIHGARTVVVNTDAVHLDSIQADRKVLIGGGVTRGMGAGGRPEIGERCAEISEQELRNQVGDADLTFITVGLGGGTGTGIAPLIAELAQAAGSVVITLATTPFRAERGRMSNARAGIQRLRGCSDSLIVLDNNRLLDLVPNLPVEQAFAVMDHLISEVIKGITESITLPSLINLDFSDVRTILESGGASTVFYGENSEDDTDQVVADTLDNPLLDVDYRGATGALIHISAGPGLRLRTAHEVVEGLTAHMRPEANVIFGVRVDRKYEGIIRVLAIMTGIRSPIVDAVRESVGDVSKAKLARWRRGCSHGGILFHRLREVSRFQPDPNGLRLGSQDVPARFHDRSPDDRHDEEQPERQEDGRDGEEDAREVEVHVQALPEGRAHPSAGSGVTENRGHLGDREALFSVRISDDEARLIVAVRRIRVLRILDVRSLSVPEVPVPRDDLGVALLAGVRERDRRVVARPIERCARSNRLGRLRNLVSDPRSWVRRDGERLGEREQDHDEAERENADSKEHLEEIAFQASSRDGEPEWTDN